MHFRFSRLQLVAVLVTTSFFTYVAWNKAASVQLRLKPLSAPTKVIIAFGDCSSNAGDKELDPSIASTGWSEYMQREVGVNANVAKRCG